MASYGLKYKCDFDAFVPDVRRYRLEFLFIDYGGGVTDLLGASTPVNHKWLTDEPKAPVKGSSLDMRIVNEGDTPITLFYANNDTDIKVRFSAVDVNNTLSGTNDITSDSGAFIGIVGFVIPAELLTSLQTLSFNGNTYNIISAYTSGVDSFLGIDTDLGADFFPDTDFVITYSAEIKTTLFEGFLVQDDCSEVMLDTRHELQLSANDGLGLLKDIPLNNDTFLTVLYAWEPHNISTTAPNTISIVPSQYGAYLPYPPFGVSDNYFEIKGTSFDDVYVATAITAAGGGVFDITIAETVTTNAAQVGYMVHYQAVDFAGRNNLLALIGVCLNNTGLELNTVVYGNIYEINHNAAHDENPDVDTICFLQSTFVDTSTFLSGENYDNCYTVMEKICKTFNLTVFQSYGKWCIRRTDELRYFDDFAIPATVHKWAESEPMEIIGRTTLAETFNLGPEETTYPETGLTRSILRPFEFVKREFNYEQPKYLLKNYDLHEVGSVLNTVASGTTFTSGELYLGVEYEITNYNPLDDFSNVGGTNATGAIFTVKGGSTPSAWAASTLTIRRKIDEYAIVDNAFIGTNHTTGGLTDSDIFIRVVTGGFNIEEQRYLVVRGGSFGPSQLSIKYIEIDNQDHIEFNARVRTAHPQALPDQIQTILRVEFIECGVTDIEIATGNTEGTVTPSWSGGGIWNTNPTDDTTEWHDIKVTPPITRHKGLLEIWLSQDDSTGGPSPSTGETHYTDIRLIYKPQINESIKVDGHIHKTEQDLDIKNNEDIELQLDDSPRNAIRGTLFLAGLTSLTQARTVGWHRTGSDEMPEQRKLQDIITQEQLFWRQNPRTKLEGTFYEVKQGNKFISMLSVLRNNIDDLSDAFFVFGSLQIDYKNNKFDCTQWEIAKDGEEENEMDYSFNYKYSTQ